MVSYTLRAKHRDTFRLVPVGSTDPDTYIHATTDPDGLCPITVEPQQYYIYCRPAYVYDNWFLADPTLLEDFLYIRTLNPQINEFGVLDLSLPAVHLSIDLAGDPSYVKLNDTVYITVGAYINGIPAGALDTVPDVKLYKAAGDSIDENVDTLVETITYLSGSYVTSTPHLYQYSYQFTSTTLSDQSKYYFKAVPGESNVISIYSSLIIYDIQAPAVLSPSGFFLSSATIGSSVEAPATNISSVITVIPDPTFTDDFSEPYSSVNNYYLQPYMSNAAVAGYDNGAKFDDDNSSLDRYEFKANVEVEFDGTSTTLTFNSVDDDTFDYIEDSASGFLVDKFREDQELTIAGTTDGLNNGIFIITSVTASRIYVNPNSFVDQAGILAVTLKGKHGKLEEWFANAPFNTDPPDNYYYITFDDEGTFHTEYLKGKGDCTNDASAECFYTTRTTSSSWTPSVNTRYPYRIYKHSPGICSDTDYPNQTACEAATETWTPDVSSWPITFPASGNLVQTINLVQDLPSGFIVTSTLNAYGLLITASDNAGNIQDNIASMGYDEILYDTTLSLAPGLEYAFKAGTDWTSPDIYTNENGWFNDQYPYIVLKAINASGAMEDQFGIQWSINGYVWNSANPSGSSDSIFYIPFPEEGEALIQVKTHDINGETSPIFTIPYKWDTTPPTWDLTSGTGYVTVTPGFNRIQLAWIEAPADPNPSQGTASGLSHINIYRDDHTGAAFNDATLVATIPSNSVSFVDTSFAGIDYSGSSLQFRYWGKSVDIAGNEQTTETDLTDPANPAEVIPLIPADVDGALRLEETLVQTTTTYDTYYARYGISSPVEAFSLQIPALKETTENLIALKNISHAPEVDGTGDATPVYAEIPNLYYNDAEVIPFHGVPSAWNDTTLQFTIDDVDLPANGVTTGLIRVIVREAYAAGPPKTGDTFVNGLTIIQGWINVVLSQSGDDVLVTIQQSVDTADKATITAADTANKLEIGLFLDREKKTTFTFDPIQGSYFWKAVFSENINNVFSWTAGDTFVDGVKLDTILAADLIVGGTLRLEKGLSIWSGGFVNGLATGDGMTLDKTGLTMFSDTQGQTVRMNTEDGSFRFGNTSNYIEWETAGGGLLNIVGHIHQVSSELSGWDVDTWTFLGAWDENEDDYARGNIVLHDNIYWFWGYSQCSEGTSTGNEATTAECTAVSGTWTPPVCVEDDCEPSVPTYAYTAGSSEYPWVYYAVDTIQGEASKTFSLTSSSQVISFDGDNNIVSTNPIELTANASNLELTGAIAWSAVAPDGYMIDHIDETADSEIFNSPNNEFDFNAPADAFDIAANTDWQKTTNIISILKQTAGDHEAMEFKQNGNDEYEYIYHLLTDLAVGKTYRVQGFIPSESQSDSTCGVGSGAPSSGANYSSWANSDHGDSTADRTIDFDFVPTGTAGTLVTGYIVLGATNQSSQPVYIDHLSVRRKGDDSLDLFQDTGGTNLLTAGEAATTTYLLPVTFIAADMPRVVISATATDYAAGELTDEVTIYKLIAGTDSYNILLTNESHTVSTDSSGGNGEWGDATTTINLYKGTTLTEAQITFSATTASWTAAYLSNDNPGNNPGVSLKDIGAAGAETGVTTINVFDSANFTVPGSPTISDPSYVGSVTFTVTRVREGQAGETYSIVSDSNTIVYEPNAGTFTPSSLTLTATKKIGEGTPSAYTTGYWRINGDDWALNQSGLDWDSDTYYPTPGYITVDLATANDADTIVDSESIPILDSSSDAYTLDLSNDTASASNTPEAPTTWDVSNATTIIRLYQGAALEAGTNFIDVDALSVNWDYSTDAGANWTALTTSSTMSSTDIIRLNPSNPFPSIDSASITLSFTPTDHSLLGDAVSITFTVSKSEHGEAGSDSLTMSLSPESYTYTIDPAYPPSAITTATKFYVYVQNLSTSNVNTGRIIVTDDGDTDLLDTGNVAIATLRAADNSTWSPEVETYVPSTSFLEFAVENGSSPAIFVENTFLKVTVTLITDEPQTFTDVITIYQQTLGDETAISYLTNENHTYAGPEGEEYSGISFGDGLTEVRVEKGGVTYIEGNGGVCSDETSTTQAICEAASEVWSGNNTYKVTDSPTLQGIDGDSGSTGANQYKFTPDDLSLDSGYIDFEITYDGITTTKRFSFSVTRVGDTGVDAESYSISTDYNVVVYDPNSDTYTPPGDSSGGDIVCSATKKIGDASPTTFSGYWSINGGDDWSDALSTFNITDMTTAKTVLLSTTNTDGNTTGVVDSETIPVLDSSSDVWTVDLTNDNVTVPETTTPGSYTITLAKTQVKLYQGADEDTTADLIVASALTGTFEQSADGSSGWTNLVNTGTIDSGEWVRLKEDTVLPASITLGHTSGAAATFTVSGADRGAPGTYTETRYAVTSATSLSEGTNDLCADQDGNNIAGLTWPPGNIAGSVTDLESSGWFATIPDFDGANVTHVFSTSALFTVEGDAEDSYWGSPVFYTLIHLPPIGTSLPYWNLDTAGLPPQLHQALTAGDYKFLTCTPYASGSCDHTNTSDITSYPDNAKILVLNKEDKNDASVLSYIETLEANTDWVTIFYDNSNDSGFFTFQVTGDTVTTATHAFIPVTFHSSLSSESQQIDTGDGGITGFAANGVEFRFSKALQGTQGIPGPGTAFRGEWESGTTYTKTDELTEIVLAADTNYYICSLTHDSVTGNEPPNTSVWAEFGATFSSVATGLLLAENAIITKELSIGVQGGDSGRIVAQSGTCNEGTDLNTETKCLCVDWESGATWDGTSCTSGSTTGYIWYPYFDLKPGSFSLASGGDSLIVFDADGITGYNTTPEETFSLSSATGNFVFGDADGERLEYTDGVLKLYGTLMVEGTALDEQIRFINLSVDNPVFQWENCAVNWEGNIPIQDNNTPGNETNLPQEFEFIGTGGPVLIMVNVSDPENGYEVKLNTTALTPTPHWDDHPGEGANETYGLWYEFYSSSSTAGTNTAGLYARNVGTDEGSIKGFRVFIQPTATSAVFSVETGNTTGATFTWEAEETSPAIAGSGNLDVALTSVTNDAADPNDNVATLTLTNFQNASNNKPLLSTGVKVKLTATKAGWSSSTSDSITVYRNLAGAPGISSIIGYLTNEVHAIEGPETGEITGITSADGEFKMYDGIIEVADANVTFAATACTNCTGTIISDGTYEITQIDSGVDSGILQLTAAYGGVTVEKNFVLTVAREGSIGPDGPVGPDGPAGDGWAVTVIGTQLDSNSGNQQFINTDGIDITSTGRGHRLIFFDTVDGSVTENIRYDTYGDSAAQSVASMAAMAAKLDSYAAGSVVGIYSYDATGVDADLRTALQGWGSASTATWIRSRKSHVFIGVKGASQGQAYEDTNSGSSADDAVASATYSHITSGLLLNGSVGPPGPGGPPGAAQFQYDDLDTTGMGDRVGGYQFQNGGGTFPDFSGVNGMQSGFQNADRVVIYKLDDAAVGSNDNSEFFSSVTEGGTFVYYITPERWYQYTILAVDTTTFSNRFAYHLQYITHVVDADNPVPTGANHIVYFLFGGLRYPLTRGSRNLHVDSCGVNGGTSWQDALATTTASEDGGPIRRDVVTEYCEANGFSETQYWDGNSWESVAQVIDGNLVVQGTIDTEHLAADAITAEKIEAGAVTADKLTIGQGNLLTSPPGTRIDGSYITWAQMQAAGWSVHGGGTIALSTYSRREYGSNNAKSRQALCLTSNGMENAKVYSEWFPIDPAVTYAISCNLSAGGSGSDEEHSLYFGVHFSDSVGSSDDIAAQGFVKSNGAAYWNDEDWTELNQSNNYMWWQTHVNSHGSINTLGGNVGWGTSYEYDDYWWPMRRMIHGGGASPEEIQSGGNLMRNYELGYAMKNEGSGGSWGAANYAIPPTATHMRLRWLNYQTDGTGGTGNYGDAGAATALLISDVSIRPSNSSIIDGSSITTGSITADTIDADFITTDDLTAGDLTITGTLSTCKFADVNNSIQIYSGDSLVDTFDAGTSWDNDNEMPTDNHLILYDCRNPCLVVVSATSATTTSSGAFTGLRVQYSYNGTNWSNFTALSTSSSSGTAYTSQKYGHKHLSNYGWADSNVQFRQRIMEPNNTGNNANKIWIRLNCTTGGAEFTSSIWTALVINLI